jgi:hypothetical protein
MTRTMSPTTAAPLFVKCQLDEAVCKVGPKHLKEYRKERDDRRGVWKDRPFHADTSHGGDAFMSFACSNIAEGERMAQTTHVDRHRRLFSKTTFAGVSMAHLPNEGC